MFNLIIDLLMLGQSFEQIVEGIKRGVKRKVDQDNFIGLLSLVRDHFNGVSPTFVNRVAGRHYSVGRSLMVPFRPPMIYGHGGQIHFPWFSFWRSNPLQQEGLSLFVSIVEDILRADPDLENVNFTILDFSSPKPKKPRLLKVIDVRDVPRISKDRLNEMLQVFVEGYELAKSELKTRPPIKDPKDPTAGKDDHPDLFDPKKIT